MLLNILKKTALLFSGRMLELGAGILIGALVNRYLGPERVGTYATALAFAGFLAPFTGAGIQALATRFFSKKEIPDCEVFWYLTLLSLAGGLVCFTVISAYLVTFEKDKTMIITGVICAANLLTNPKTIPISWLQSHNEFRKLVASRNAVIITSSLFRLGIIHFDGGLYSLAINFVIIDGLLHHYILYNQIKRKGAKLKLPAIKRQKIKSFAIAVLPFAIAGSFNMLHQRIDIIMIASILNKTETGLYSTASRLISQINFVTIAVSTAIYPLLLKVKSESLAGHRTLRIFQAYSAVGYTLSITTFLASELMISLLYGDAFSGSIAVLKILAWTCLATALNNSRDQLIVAKGHFWHQISFHLLGLTCNVIGNFIAIPKYGITGAAYVSCISYYFSGVACSFLFKETRSYGYQQILATLVPLPILKLNRS